MPALSPTHTATCPSLRRAGCRHAHPRSHRDEPGRPGALATASHVVGRRSRAAVLAGPCGQPSRPLARHAAEPNSRQYPLSRLGARCQGARGASAPVARVSCPCGPGACVRFLQARSRYARFARGRPLSRRSLRLCEVPADHRCQRLRHGRDAHPCGRHPPPRRPRAAGSCGRRRAAGGWSRRCAACRWGPRCAAECWSRQCESRLTGGRHRPTGRYQCRRPDERRAGPDRILRHPRPCRRGPYRCGLCPPGRPVRGSRRPIRAHAGDGRRGPPNRRHARVRLRPPPTSQPTNHACKHRQPARPNTR